VGAVEPKLRAGEQFRGGARVYDQQDETDLKAICLFRALEAFMGQVRMHKGNT
jgi:DNA-binding transcriptional MerR regulator